MRRTVGLAPMAIALLLAGCDDSPNARFDFGAPAFLQRWDTHRVDPSSAAVGPDGTVFVAARDSVYRFSLSGDFLGVWGAPADDPGRASFARWLAVGSAGEVGVSDGRTMRLFTLEGTFLRRWNLPNQIRGERIAVSPTGTVLVADVDDQIYRFTKEGAPLSSIALAAHDSAVSEVWDVAAARNGDLVALVQHYDGRSLTATIDRYADQGALLSRQQIGSFIVGWHVAAADEIYVLGWDTIVRFSDSLEEVSRWTVDPNSDDIVAVPSSGVLAFDDSSGRIHVFDADGVPSDPWYGVPPWGSVGIAVPVIGTNGVVYTLEPERARVKRLDGENVTSWGRSGSGMGEFRAPRDLDVDESGFVYVADTGNGRIQKFTGTGEWVGMWMDPQPTGLAVRGGTVCVTSGGKEVRSYSTAGTLLRSFVSDSYGYDDVELDLADRMYLLDPWTHASPIVEIRTRDGILVRTIDLRGRPWNFAIDDRRWLYVLERSSLASNAATHARVMTSTGSTLGEWDLTAERPVYLDVDPQGSIVVSSEFGSIFLHAPFGTPVPAGASPLAPESR